MQRSEEINELATAMALAQGEIEGAEKDRQNTHFGSRYADLGSVWRACRGALSKHGLAVIQLPRTVYSPEGVSVDVETLLTHKTGQWLSEVLNVPVSNGNAQGIGSTITYARRYALAAMVGVAPEDDDDDGEGAVGRGAAAQQQGRDRSEQHPPATGNGNGARSSGQPNGGRVPTLPYGNSKGKAINDPKVEVSELEWMAKRMAEAVADATKVRYRDDNKRLLEALQIEILRRGREDGEPKVEREPASAPPDDDIPF